ncbi:hypothetical protein GCM10010277_58760 [Streptomyces longisporoflavus]|nr:hypothetical protein GCM10010277_58760 [Streptomyces longisporoflavus]
MIFAKEMRSGAVLAPLFVFAVEAVREAAKRGSFRGLGLTTRVPVPSWTQGQTFLIWLFGQVREVSVHGAQAWACPW